MNELSLLSPREDPYLIQLSKKENGNDDDFFDDYFDEAEDMDDLTIRPTDYVLVTARTPEDDDIAQLEYYIYEEQDENLYVHHDIMLPTFPLCLEWADYPSKKDAIHGNQKILLTNFMQEILSQLVLLTLILKYGILIFLTLFILI